MRGKLGASNCLVCGEPIEGGQYCKLHYVKHGRCEVCGKLISKKAHRCMYHRKTKPNKKDN